MTNTKPCPSHPHMDIEIIITPPKRTCIAMRKQVMTGKPAATTGKYFTAVTTCRSPRHSNRWYNQYRTITGVCFKNPGTQSGSSAEEIFHLLQYPAVGRSSSEYLDTTVRCQTSHGRLTPPLPSTPSALNHDEAPHLDDGQEPSDSQLEQHIVGRCGYREG